MYDQLDQTFQVIIKDLFIVILLKGKDIQNKISYYIKNNLKNLPLKIKKVVLNMV